MHRKQPISQVHNYNSRPIEKNYPKENYDDENLKLPKHYRYSDGRVYSSVPIVNGNLQKNTEDIAGKIQLPPITQDGYTRNYDGVHISTPYF